MRAAVVGSRSDAVGNEDTRPFSRLCRGAAVAGAATSALGIAAATAYWQWRTTYSIPYWDQWGWIAQYRDIVGHGLAFEDLLRQWNEHRILFPRLVFILDMVWARGSNALDLATSDVLQCLTLAVIVGVGRSALRSALGAVAVCFTAMLLFNAAQSENVFWGFQVQFVMVHTAAVAALALAASVGCRPIDASPGLLVSSWCAATVATFSMANGLCVWPVMVLLLCARRHGRSSTATIALGLAEGALYLRGYHAVPSGDHTSFADAAHNIGACASYLLAYLGAVLAPTDPAMARLGGGVALLAGISWVWQRRGRFAGPEAWPLFVVGVFLFVLSTAALTAVGRFRFGDVQALSSRYLTPGAVLWSTLAMAWAIDVRARLGARGRTTATVLFAMIAVLIGARDESLGVVALADMTAGIPLASDAYKVGVQDNVALGAVTSDHPLAWAMRPFLAAHGLGPFADVDFGWLGRPIASLLDGRTYGGCSGAIDDASPAGQGELSGLSFEGWAWGGRDGLPSSVVIVDAAGMVVGLARLGGSRPDVPVAEPDVSSDLTGFRGYARGTSAAGLRLFTVSRDGRRVCEVGVAR